MLGALAEVDSKSRFASAAVWFYAFGYFVAYLPYSALAKALSKGWVTPAGRALSGLEILPISAMTSMVAMVITISLLRWWRYAGKRKIGGIEVPSPGIWTFLSGLATACILVTTTLAYTFQGVSIPLIMLFMRGGVLLIAPVVDVLSGRKVRWFSAIALVLSFLALLDALTQSKGFAMPALCIADIVLYLCSYFVRLRFMSRTAKSVDKAVRLRYFVEEQMVATPAAVFMLGILALVNKGPLTALRAGFVDMWSSPALPYVALVGLLSQGTGVFGGLVLLDARENSFSVPLNRASSILAGVGAAFLLAFTFSGVADPPHFPPAFELVGAGLLVVAILVLSVGPMFGRKPSAPVAFAGPEPVPMPDPKSKR
ncbi:hypothetical protein BH09MYX1_BH09MYX1_20910 [soil metagenome]